MFAFAPRYHSGGIAGLKPREVPAVLEEGEEVLPADHPRHMNNFKSGGLSMSTTMTFNGTTGDEEKQRRAGNRLDEQFRGLVRTFIADEMRPGGILARS